ncbi:helix-turn-helix domain-containing protein [Paenibacillus terrigena]|uniref:response regulator transcription factor n=1 Tax=Paenibacillus terrigena TaxID=369333 RepID=UPI0028D1ADE7|nr:helix-turn-helix domain-containing protein [Paenibacillus terrigena]
MYRALIVDDEIYAVLGIKSGVNWEELQVSEVHEAYNMREAMKVFERTPIDILICDIEMPKGTGIELLEWVNAHSPATETVFLTAHADFSFVKRAVQLDSFDYLLKPVEYEVLQSTLAKMLQSIEQEKELLQLREQYKPYYDLWTKKKPLIADKFWNDVLSNRITCTPTNVQSLLEEHDLTIKPDIKILPLLISVEAWQREFSTRDEEMMEYAIRKGASELLLHEANGVVIQTRQGVNVVIRYLDEGHSGSAGLSEACREYIQSCQQYFNCQISCYIGEVTSLFNVSEMYHELLELEYNNLHKSNQVYFLRNREKTGMMKLPLFSAWTILIEQGKREEIEKELARCIAAFRSDARLSASALQAFNHGFLQMIHYILHKNGVSAHELLYEGQGQLNGAAPRTLDQMHAWALKLIGLVSHSLHQNDSVIEQVQRYIADHLSEVITREQLAEYVHLNPAYLSRLFKREVGESITDYILNERMKVAKELIATSSMPISDIAKSLGYSNFSYFAKMFKKVYHATPQHFRRQLG